MCNRHVYGYVANIRSCQCSQSGYVLGMSRGSTPRHAQTARDLVFAVQFNADTLWHFHLCKHQSDFYTYMLC